MGLDHEMAATKLVPPRPASACARRGSRRRPCRLASRWRRWRDQRLAAQDLANQLRVARASRDRARVALLADLARDPVFPQTEAQADPGSQHISVEEEHRGLARQ